MAGTAMVAAITCSPSVAGEVPTPIHPAGQYQYGGADAAEGVRINGRGRGDEHHSLYGGHNAEIQAGIEYQTMDTPAGVFNMLTYRPGAPHVLLVSCC